MFKLFQTSDATLVAQVLSGKRETFGVLVERYLRTAYSIALARVNTHADAEDVAQESFLKAFQSLDSLREPERFGAWLAAIVRHCASRVRERRLHDASALEHVVGSMAVALPDHERIELRAIVRAEVEKLDETAREIILMYYFAGKSTKEIAQTLDSSNEAVRKRLQRAREKLGEQLLNSIADSTPADKDRTKQIMGLVAAIPMTHNAQSTKLANTSFLGSGSAIKTVGAIAIAVASIGIYWRINNRSNSPAVHLADQDSVSQAQNVAANVVPETPNSNNRIPVENNVIASSATFPYAFRTVVFDVNGEPAPGINVEVFEIPSISSVFWGEREPQVRLASVTTDKNGFFSVGIPEGTASSNDRAIQCRASKQGAYRFGRFGINYPVSHRIIPIHLLPVSFIRGSVHDAAGKPIENARIQATKFELDGKPNGLIEDDRIFTTGQDGKFVAEVYTGRCQFTVEADGYAATETPFVDSSATVDVVLSEGFRFAGTLISDGTGETVTHANLVMSGMPSRRSTSDAYGHFEFTGLNEGAKYLLLDDATRYISSDGSQITLSSSIEDTTISVQQGATISGHLVDTDTGDPIPGANVFVRWTDPKRPIQSFSMMQKIKTDAEGKYAIQGLPPNEYRVHFTGVSVIPEITSEIDFPVVEVSASEVRDGVDFMVSRKYRVSGVVRDSQGRAMPGLEVKDYDFGVSDRGEFSEYLFGSWTDDSGKFTIFLSKPSRKLVLVASNGNWTTHEFGPITVDEKGMSGIELTAYRAGSVFGRVEDAAGNGLANTSFAYKRTDSPLVEFISTDQQQRHDFQSDWTDNAGRFYVVGLAPGEYSFENAGIKKIVSIESDQTVTDIVLSTSVVRNAIIEGTVTCEGIPVKGASVMGANTYTDDNGRYRTSSIEAGELSLRAAYSRTDNGIRNEWQYSQFKLNIPSGTTTINVALGTGDAGIQGTVTRGGNPLYGVSVMAHHELDKWTSEQVTSTTNQDGQFRIAGLPAGHYDLRVRPIEATMPKRGSTEINQYKFGVDTAPGETAQLDFSLDTGTITVACSGIREGEEGYIVLIPGDESKTEITQESSDALIRRAISERDVEQDGTVEFKGALEGAYTLLFMTADPNAPNDNEQFKTMRHMRSVVLVEGNADTSVEMALR